MGIIYVLKSNEWHRQLQGPANKWELEHYAFSEKKITSYHEHFLRGSSQ